MPTNSHDEADNSLPNGPDGRENPTLVATLVAADASEECTIYPADADGMELMTRWITAHDGSFVALDDAR